ncbi:nucleoside deaminase [Lysobacter arvi]|uniref:Nucleoside deaminase n=1 Tax=Lysobacter arvi TaxID=3038776 RepID=A0ABU1C8F6_9GAMM|nr:nucleoside deaminase [Lysobacter arvi]MDR0181471.1 nucleoside deaminase [Lysobacter arvi]
MRSVSGQGILIRPVPESSMPESLDFMREAIALARANVADGGRPFGAVLVRDGEVLARAANRIHATNDPTAHAELLAIRDAAQRCGSPRLDGAVVYAGGHPCPMCLAAMHLCGVTRGYYAYSNEDGAPFGLSTAHVLAQMALPPSQQSLAVEALRPEGEGGLYESWAARRV